MAQIVTITNPLTGQPAQVDQLEHTAQQIDDGIGFESTDYSGCYYRMVDGVVEWLNPPMLLGVEYRTTERYDGKPVYKRAVSIGDITGDGTASFASNGATTVLSGELLYNGYLPFNFIHERNLSSSWTRYANVTRQVSNIEVDYYIGASYGTSKDTVVILRYLKD